MFLTFLTSLRQTGQAELDPGKANLLTAIRTAGDSTQEQHAAISELLEPWFLQDRMRVPGEPLDFHPKAALWGAQFIFRAMSFYTFREIVEAEVKRGLEELSNAMPDSHLPAAHLSADLMLRYLPELHTRAQRISLEDVLTQNLAALANLLPLSGVGIAERTIAVNHPIFTHSGLSQYIVERAIEFKCRTTLTQVPALQNLAISKLGNYSDRLAGDLFTTTDPTT